MQFLKILLFIIIGIIALLLIVAVFVKRDYLIKRDIVINKPKSVVFDFIRFLKNQDNFSKWVMADPNMSKQFTGTDGTVGFTYAWESKDKNVGKGEQEIVGITADQKVNIEIRFIKPFEGTGIAELATQTVAPEQIKVTWQMAGKSKYPMNITNLIIDNILGKDLEASLSNLKNVLE